MKKQLTIEKINKAIRQVRKELKKAEEKERLKRIDNNIEKHKLKDLLGLLKKELKQFKENQLKNK